MEQNNIPPTMSTTEPVKGKPSYGGLLAVLIILIAIVVGAFYFWGERVSQESQMLNDLESLETQGESTEATAIQADLDATSPDEFDAEFDAAFNELDAAFDEEQ